MNHGELLEHVIRVAKEAGQAIMAVYTESDFDITTKEDNSPLTKADLAAQACITKGLRRFSTYPQISEEGEHGAPGATLFWLIDPLDGTKEFIKKSGEFTVNIALIQDGQPILGVVYAPAQDTLYAAAEHTAFCEINGLRQSISSVFGKGKPKVVMSRSHGHEAAEALVQALGLHEALSIGSSLKLCLVAAGKALLYPRLGPTYGWDTAAAHAIIRIAGGHVEDLAGQELAYVPQAKKNPYFIAFTKDGATIKKKASHIIQQYEKSM